MDGCSEEDRERVGQRLKDADSSIWFKLISVYRYIAKASKDGIATLDMGIPSLGERLTLTGRVKDFLGDQEVLLSKLAPKVLLEKTFTKDEPQKSFAEIWETFLKYPELPMLENEKVLKDTIIQGVQNGLFGVTIGEKIRYMETVSAEEMTDDVLILRKEIAEKMKKETKEGPIPPEGGAPQPPAAPIEPRPTPEKIRKVKLTAQVPWDKLSDLMRGVFSPLHREGAKIAPLEVKIEAEAELGISRDTLDLKIRETLSQIGAKVVEEEVE